MTKVYLNQEDFWKIWPDTLYYWNVKYSRNFKQGYDGSFELKCTIPDLLNFVVTFFHTHLFKDETAILSVFNTHNVEEVEAIITKDSLIYLNGLGEYVRSNNKTDSKY